MIRVFIALPVPGPVAARFAALVPAGLTGLKRVAPELMHVTLAFIGWTAEDSVGRISEAVSTGAQGEPAFGVRLEHVGRFPLSGRPRVVWVGPPEDVVARIERLGGSVRAELARRSVAFDEKALVSHVTLARLREEATAAEAAALGEAIAAARVPADAAFEAEAVHVMRSVLTRQGPRYSSLRRIALSAGRGGG